MNILQISAQDPFNKSSHRRRWKRR